LTNLISIYDKVTHLADQGKPVDVVVWDFSKAFDAVFHSILLWQHATISYGSHKASKTKQKQQQKHFNG